MRWDIFCKVIDNHGDIGVCWRLARELAARGHAIRLWVDDPSALDWMAPGGAAGVEVVAWDGSDTGHAPGDVVVEAFGCDPHAAFLAAMRQVADRLGRQPAWFNLEYLSAEGYVERSHGLPSPVMSGPAAGLVKRFHYPGFTAGTGGLLRERDLSDRQQCFDAGAWLARAGLPVRDALRISLFCYEPAALGQLLARLDEGQEDVDLFVTAGRAAAAAKAVLAAAPRSAHGSLRIHWLPLLTQPDYDHLLWSCDFNFVRGEDSLVRALWAGKPFAWHIYPQDDGAHAQKLHAFLDWAGAPAELRTLHQVWNGLSPGDALPPLDPRGWQPAARDARQRALTLPELAGSLADAARQWASR
jgi:uncharacterized repeat protein (TIGR03837 family)